MLGWLWRRKVKPPTKQQLRQAKALGITSASDMSRASLAVIIAKAEKKRTARAGK